MGSGVAQHSPPLGCRAVPVQDQTGRDGKKVGVLLHADVCDAEATHFAMAMDLRVWEIKFPGCSPHGCPGNFVELFGLCC